jgi:DNA-binding HxlR family transcriptional regulator
LARSKPKEVKMGPKLLYQQDPVRGSVKALGSKWTLLILRDIGFLKLERFGQILRNNPGLTPRVLSRRLRNMQKEDLIERTVKTDRITYALSPRGEDAAYVLLAFLRYGLKYHASSLETTKVKSLPSFQDLMREYYGTKS